ncbi:MAG: pilus assembly protein PilM [Burkholderiales bacterium]|nr:pilus assembly protein PilM [Burkholderiales bacterium]
MFFSFKNNKDTGLMAVKLAAQGLYSAIVSPRSGSLPVLEFLSFYPMGTHSWETLLTRLAKESPARQKRCAVLLNTAEYQSFALDSINVPENELKSAVRFRLNELLDYPAESACIDVLTVPGDSHQGGHKQSLIAIAAKSSEISRYQALFAAAKLNLTVIDVHEMAQRNISSLLELEGRGLAMLSFDQQGGLLTVSFGGELYLSRRLDVSLTDLYVEDEQRRQESFERISLELQRSLDHFDRQHNYITTAKLVLAPLGAVSEELRTFLAANMYLPVENLDLASIIALDQLPELRQSEQQQMYFHVIGAALRSDEVVA